jgi:hypothetical protein
VSTHHDFEDNSGLLIVGDIHGNLQALLHILEVVDKMMVLPSTRAKVCFILVYLIKKKERKKERKKKRKENKFNFIGYIPR